MRGVVGDEILDERFAGPLGSISDVAVECPGGGNSNRDLLARFQYRVIATNEVGEIVIEQPAPDELVTSFFLDQQPMTTVVMVGDLIHERITEIERSSELIKRLEHEGLDPGTISPEALFTDEGVIEFMFDCLLEASMQASGDISLELDDGEDGFERCAEGCANAANKANDITDTYTDVVTFFQVTPIDPDILLAKGLQLLAFGVISHNREQCTLGCATEVSPD